MTARRRARGAQSAPWVDGRGKFGERSRAYERTDRRGTIWIVFIDPDPAALGRRVRMPLPGAPESVRTPDGAIDEQRALAAANAHVAFRQQLSALGRIPDRSPKRGHGVTMASTGATPAENEAACSALTLRTGFDRWLSLSSGKFAAKTKRWKCVAHAADTLCADFSPATPWAALTPRVFSEYRRELARSALKKGGAGLRRAEIIIDAFYSVGSWLRKNELLPRDVGHAPEGWRGELQNDWAQITGRVNGPARPRHTPDEVRLLFAALNNPRVDPRMALLMELVAEQRMGQGLRAMRSDLEVPTVGADAPMGRHGRLRLRGAGRKRTAPVALSPTQRDRVDVALTSGYLRELEGAYKRGELADYALFPGGRLKKGIVPLDASGARPPMRPERARYLFRKLEKIAGVPSRPGRGWYGVRRAATDLAQDVSTDDRVLNAISGHSDSRTREQIYQERHREADLIKAATVRETLRGRDAHVSARDATPAAIQAEIAQLEERLRTLRSSLRLNDEGAPSE